MWHDVKQGSDEWHTLRVGKVTSSNAGLFMANSPGAFGDPAKRYALSVALERITGEQQEGYSNEHMQRGIEQEPIARMLYEEWSFSTVTNGGFFDLGDYGDSPDGLIDDGLVEIKCVTPFVHYANMRRGEPDPAYRWQIISHLECTGLEWCDFVSYCSAFPEQSRLIVYRVNADDVVNDLAALRERREKFLELVKSIQKALA